MTQNLVAVGVALALMSNPAARCRGEEAMEKLPAPHYHKKRSDPAWLAAAVQFHGHLGPWATAGTRAGMAGLRAVGAGGYFDVEVTCEGPFVKPPRSCFLDGLQVATGATMGKRNLHWVEADKVVVRIKNTRTGRQAEVRPTAKLMELASSFKPSPKVGTGAANAADDKGEAGHGDDALEAIARKIASLPEREIVIVTVVGP